MKVLLEIKDEKAPFIMELLKNFKFVKTQPLTPYKSDIFKDIKEAVDEMNLIKNGEGKSQSLSNFLDEL